jgi:hypothetical protein
MEVLGNGRHIHLKSSYDSCSPLKRIAMLSDQTSLYQAPHTDEALVSTEASFPDLYPYDDGGFDWNTFLEGAHLYLHVFWKLILAIICQEPLVRA